jgi:hypothetical protein
MTLSWREPDSNHRSLSGIVADPSRWRGNRRRASERPFLYGGTDGSNPVPSSGDSGANSSQLKFGKHSAAGSWAQATGQLRVAVRSFGERTRNDMAASSKLMIIEAERRFGPHPSRRSPRRTWRPARLDESVARRELWRRWLGADALWDARRAQRAAMRPRPSDDPVMNMRATSAPPLIASTYP